MHHFCAKRVVDALTRHLSYISFESRGGHVDIISYPPRGGAILGRMRLPLSLYAALLGSMVLVLPTATLAQFGSEADPFTISVSPAAPVPYSLATLTPVAGQIDITNATMVVTMGGAEVYRGNAKPIALTMGAAGATLAVVVRMQTAASSYKQTFSITPQDVVLVAEPLASAPPLYAGKPLVPLGGSVRVVAMADLRTTAGTRLDPTTLSYAWTVDGTASDSASGIGKRTIIVDSPLQYRSSTVEVRVVSPNGALVAASSLDLVASEPTLRIYEKDPLLGIRFDHALGSSYELKGSEATLYGAAYSFQTALGAPLLRWFLNGAVVQGGPLLTLRPTGPKAGTASLSLTGASSDVAAASAGLTVSYGSTASTNIFGL